MSDPYYQATLPSHVPPHLVHDFNVYDFGDEDPFVACRNLYDRQIEPVFWTRHNGGHWIVRNSETITEVTRKPALFSSSRNAVPDSMNSDIPLFLPILADPPDHAGYRSLVAPLLSPRRVAEIERKLHDLTATIIENLVERGECEFMADFSTQMPIIAFLELLDLPLSDREYLLDIANRVVKPKEGEDRLGPMNELFDYLRPVLRKRIAAPGSDALSQLVSSTIDGKAVDFEDFVILAASLVLGGLDSTAATIAYFARHLADFPADRRMLIDNPSLIPLAVDEIFRRFAPGTLGRILTEDAEFHGVPMREGDHVQWVVAMHNLDDALYPDPLKVDFNRKRVAHHTFGTGIHFCIGAQLARTEMRIFAEHWLRRIPNFSVKPDAQIKYRSGINICFENLPLVFEN